MKRRYLILAISFAAFVGIVLGVAYPLARPTPGVTLDNAHRVRYAMTLEEVENLFVAQGAVQGGGCNCFMACWKNGDLEIAVSFGLGIADPNTGKYVASDVLHWFEGQDIQDIIQFRPPDDNRLLAKLRRWLHLD